MRLTIVVAASENNVIGAKGGLPWHLPEDLRRFREITMGKPMIMGRATYESIGRALPGRRSIVVTRQVNFVAEGCDVVASPEDALALVADAGEVMIIGGGKIYEQLLPRIDRIFLTRVHAEIDGDTFFPALDAAEWRKTATETLPPGDKRPWPISFETLERINGKTGVD